MKTVRRTYFKHSRIISECVGILMCLITTILVFAFEFAVWDKDFNVPYFVYGDSSAINNFVMNEIRGAAPWYIMQNIQYPFGSVLSTYSDGIGNTFLLLLLGKLTNNIGYAGLLFYLLTYLLTATFTYFSLRMVRLNIRVSCIGGIIYAFLPAHFYRIGHINIYNYAYLPIILSYCLLRYEYRQKELTWGDLSRKDRVWYGIVCVACIIAGMSSLYYALMCILTVVVAELVCILKFRRWGGCKLTCIVVCCIVLGIVNTVLIGLHYPTSDTNQYVEIIDVEEDDIITQSSLSSYFALNGRDAWGGVKYSLRPYVMFLPVLGDRISVLDEWGTRIYEEVDKNVEDDFMSTLGIVMALGIISSFAIFLRKEEKGAIVEMAAKMVVLLILCFMAHGFVTFLSLINAGIRSYNRGSILISYFSLVLILKIVEEKVSGLKYVWKEQVVLSVVLILALTSQITPKSQKYLNCAVYERHGGLGYEDTIAPTFEQYEQYHNSLFQFFEDIQNMNMKIIAYWDTSPTAMQIWTTVYGEKLMSNICSSDIRYTYFWEWIESKDIQDRIAAIAYLGYDCIILEDGVESFDRDYGELSALLGQPIVKTITENAPGVSNSKMAYAFDLTKMKEHLETSELDISEAKGRFYELYEIYRKEQRR